MEHSPLRFLDNDVGIMLSDKLRIIKEDMARKFHSNNFENSNIINLNNKNHYTISNVYDNDFNYRLNYAFMKSLYGDDCMKKIIENYDKILKFPRLYKCRY